MRMLRILAAWCLVLMMLCTTALAEVPFLIHSQGWTLNGTPLDVTLSADVTSRMPYDEDRIAMLKAVTDNLSVQLTTGTDEGSVAILIGQSEAVRLSYLDNEVQISTVPELSFTTASDPLEALLGASAGAEPELFGLSAESETLLDDGWVILSGIDPALSAYADRRNVKTSITDMGTARSCTDYTIPKGEAEQLKETLLQLCPDGWLKEIIGSLTFSGKQTFRIYRTADEVPLRMEYNGTCGPEGNLRTVKLIWRTRRDEKGHRDEVTLTSPAKSGGNKNTLEFKRLIKESKSGKIEMTGSFTYTVTADKKTTVRKGEFDLTNVYTKESDAVTGSFTLQQKLPGEDRYAGITISPDMTITGSEDDPRITGTIEVKTLSGKNVLDQAKISVAAVRSEGSHWEAREDTLDLDALSGEELDMLQTDVLNGAASQIVRMLIILMQEDADWFFRDLPPETVQRIIDASDRVVME